MLADPGVRMQDPANGVAGKGSTTPTGLHLLLSADQHAVRNGLRRVTARLRDLDVDEDLRGTVEIVLAEVLNNVVEHAFADRLGGLIELEAQLHEDQLAFSIRDDGHPLPSVDMPAGRAQNLDVGIQDLPEGGFGWLLIRELTEGLSYCRDQGRNQLTFTVPRRQPAA